MEDVLLLEEMAEEDEELDLYNEMTFGLGKTSGESWCWRDLPALGGSRQPGGHCSGINPPYCALLPPSKTETPQRRMSQNCWWYRR